ncbi:MAG: hypothetical protein HC904_17175 [Blastochloris sp.]|nr:hypothetical protein [Blastochloris sp.]
MRLSRSELRLVILFLGLLFVVANLFSIDYLIKKKRGLVKELQQLELNQREASVWLGSGEYWLKRKAWLDEKQPRIEAEGQQSSLFWRRSSNQPVSRTSPSATKSSSTQEQLLITKRFPFNLRSADVWNPSPAGWRNCRIRNVSKPSRI